MHQSPFSYPAGEFEKGLPIELANGVIHPDDVARVNARIQRTVEKGEPYKSEYRIKRNDGTYLWILASGRCEFDIVPTGPLPFLVLLSNRRQACAFLVSMFGKSRPISDWAIGWQATNVEIRAGERRQDHLPSSFTRAPGHTNLSLTRGCQAESICCVPEINVGQRARTLPTVKATFRTPRRTSGY
uniref:PAS domain-containing protein n=1 Tax=Caballeronia sp. LjRoot34 TaxID=3342325 RepID=UPI003F4F9FE6